MSMKIIVSRASCGSAVGVFMCRGAGRTRKDHDALLFSWRVRVAFLPANQAAT
jgi:hypothetical protein